VQRLDLGRGVAIQIIAVRRSGGSPDLGFECILVLTGEMPQHALANSCSINLSGAQVVLCVGRKDRDRILQQTFDCLLAERGMKPYLVIRMVDRALPVVGGYAFAVK